MPDIGGSYSEHGFHRQRRNLIVGSIILVFVHVAEVRLLNTQGSLLGLPIAIGKPEAIQWFLFVAVWYWALRFYQFHRQRRASELSERAQAFMRQFLERRAIDLIDPAAKFEPPPLPEGLRLKPGHEPFSFHLGPFMYRHMVPARIKRAWHIEDVDGQVRVHQEEKEHHIQFRGWLLWRARVLGYIHASINSAAFTEFFLPYLFFFVSITYATYRLLTH